MLFLIKPLFWILNYYMCLDTTFITIPIIVIFIRIFIVIIILASFSNYHFILQSFLFVQFLFLYLSFWYSFELLLPRNVDSLLSTKLNLCRGTQIRFKQESRRTLFFLFFFFSFFFSIFLFLFYFIFFVNRVVNSQGTILFQQGSC